MMALSSVQTVDVAAELVRLLEDVEGVRVYAYISDVTKPPACVVGQPDLDFTDVSGGYCRAVWLFPLTVVVTRSNDRAAQTQMSQLLLDIVTALSVDDVGPLFSVEPLDARPITVSIGTSAELPAYLLNVRVRA